MPKQIWRFISIYFFILIINSSSIPSQAIENDLQLWPTVVLETPVYKEKINAFAEIRPTATNDISEVRRILLRGALFYNLTKKTSLWAGAEYYPTLSDDVVKESRAWQQIAFKNKVRNFNVETRFRLEERFIENVDQVSLRNRNRIKVTYPIGKTKKTYLATSDELFLNLNSTSPSIRAGFNENRWFVGVGRNITDNFKLEGGYQLTFNNRINRPDFLGHAIRVDAAFKIPSLSKIIRGK